MNADMDRKTLPRVSLSSQLDITKHTSHRG
jgi:hypothetical protein